MTHIESEPQKSSTGFTGMMAAILTGLFIGLKMTGAIDWPWYYVLAPTIVYVGLHVLFAAIIFGITIMFMATVFIHGVKNKKPSQNQEHGELDE